MGQACGHLPDESPGGIYRVSQSTLTDCPRDQICRSCATRLRQANANTKEFTLDGTTATGKVVNVYDGDTIHVVIIVFNRLYKFKCRLSGIDTPELRVSRNDPHRELHRQAGLKVAKYVSDLINDKLVRLEIHSYDKYGRLLCDVYTYNGVSINQLLVDKKFALPYDGGTKSIWTPEMLKQIIEVSL